MSAVSLDIFQAAVDWAWDLRTDPSHTFITGCPFGDSRDRVARLLVDAFVGLDLHALDELVGMVPWSDSRL